MTKRPFPKKKIKQMINWSHFILIFVAQFGYEYFVTFIDDYSKYQYIYLLHYKFEFFEKFKELKDRNEQIT